MIEQSKEWSGLTSSYMGTGHQYTAVMSFNPSSSAVSSLAENARHSRHGGCVQGAEVERKFDYVVVYNISASCCTTATARHHQRQRQCPAIANAVAVQSSSHLVTKTLRTNRV